VGLHSGAFKESTRRERLLFAETKRRDCIDLRLKQLAAEEIADRDLFVAQVHVGGRSIQIRRARLKFACRLALRI
jgi:hypothetical protein